MRPEIWDNQLLQWWQQMLWWENLLNKCWTKGTRFAINTSRVLVCCCDTEKTQDNLSMEVPSKTLTATRYKPHHTFHASWISFVELSVQQLWAHPLTKDALDTFLDVWHGIIFVISDDERLPLNPSNISWICATQVTGNKTHTMLTGGAQQSVKGCI